MASNFFSLLKFQAYDIWTVLQYKYMY